MHKPDSPQTASLSSAESTSRSAPSIRPCASWCVSFPASCTRTFFRSPAPWCQQPKVSKFYGVHNTQLLPLTWQAHTSPKPPLPRTRYIRNVLYVICNSSSHFHCKYLRREGEMSTNEFLFGSLYCEIIDLFFLVFISLFFLDTNPTSNIFNHRLEVQWVPEESCLCSACVRVNGEYV